MERNTVQLNFISRIREMLPKNYSLVDEIADLLDVSKDSAYRRIRGETALTIDEIVILCNRFKISLDSFLQDDLGSVTFGYGRVECSEKGFINYLESIANDLERISKAEQKEIYYAAEDIPIFHHYRFPGLAKFKMFYWMKSVLNVPDLEKQKYNPALINDEILDIGKRIQELYTSIPSVEIWTDVTIISLLKQIEYYWETGLFRSRDDAISVCNEAAEEFEFINHQAELSTKYLKEADKFTNENNFALYYSDIEINNNCILVTANDMKVVYLTHNTFNKISTTNVRFCEDTYDWFRNLIKKAVLISGVSEKQRVQYFRKVNSWLDETRNRIIS